MPIRLPPPRLPPGADPRGSPRSPSSPTLLLTLSRLGWYLSRLAEGLPLDKPPVTKNNCYTLLYTNQRYEDTGAALERVPWVPVNPWILRALYTEEPFKLEIKSNI